MENEVKYFKAEVGHLVSDGKTKIRFPISIIAVIDKQKIKLLELSKSVVEVTEEEAIEAHPQVFGKEENLDKDPEDDKKKASTDAEPSKKELIDAAKKLGVSNDDIKKAKNKPDLMLLIENAKEKAAQAKA